MNIRPRETDTSGMARPLGSESDQEIIEKYKTINDKIFMTIDEAIVLSRYLASQISESGEKPYAVIGIATGALLMAKVIADELAVPCEVITIRRRGSHIKDVLRKQKLLLKIVSFLYVLPVVNKPLVWLMRRFESLSIADTPTEDKKLRNKSVVLIDDCIESGNTLRAARSILSNQGASHIYIAVISWSQRQDSIEKNNIVPDVFLCRRIQHYPWSSNSPYFEDFIQWLRNNKMGQWV